MVVVNVSVVGEQACLELEASLARTAGSGARTGPKGAWGDIIALRGPRESFPLPLSELPHPRNKTLGLLEAYIRYERLRTDDSLRRHSP